MHELVAFLKEAVTRTPNAGINGCYIVRNGHIYSRTPGLQAGVPMESEINFNIPAHALDKALARMKEISELAIDDEQSTVTITAGRLRTTIKCNTQDPPDMPSLPKKWKPCPPDLVTGLSLALPFIGERGWSLGIRLKTGKITALCNTSAIDISVKGLTLPNELLLTKETADFLIAQGAPDQYQAEEVAILFRWNDGRWVRAQLLNDKMQSNVDSLFDKAHEKVDKWFAVDEAFREAFADACALSDSRLKLSETGFDVRQSDMDAHVNWNGFPVGHVSFWEQKCLEKVFACAERWSPLRYPGGCPFVGENFRGVAMGITKWM